MPDPLADVTPGQRVRHSAERTNAWNAAARVLRRRGTTADDATEVSSLSPIVISVTLAAGDPVDAGGVVGLGEAIYEPADERVLPEVAFEAAAPTQDNADKRQLAIMAEQVRPGGTFARAYVAGVFPAKVSFSTAGHAFAKVTDGESAYLASAADDGEYRVLWSPGTTGEQWALVTPNSGGSLPAPTQKYQVYTPITDTLKPIWTSMRVQG